MDSYEINKDTCAIISVEKNISRVLENNNEYYVNMPSYEIMDNSCQYYGSSCEGRIKGTKMILGSSYKVPIVVEEKNDIIFFPTESPNSDSCCWLSLNQIEKYENCNDKFGRNFRHKLLPCHLRQRKRRSYRCAERR